MSLGLFLLWLVSIPFAFHANANHQGYSINCGASSNTAANGVEWILDEGFINVGNKSTLDTSDLMPILATLRFFPDRTANKYCYEVPATIGGKYMVRTTYYYGNFDGGKEPPVFDQIVGGTKWSTVNITEDYLNGQTSYYEIIVAAMGRTLSICLARNEHTKSDPFISALEVNYLSDSLYNSTDFSKNALITVARHSFGYNDQPIRFPDDQFNRYWQPFTDNNPIAKNHTNVNASNSWNLPPTKVFETALTTSRGKTLDIQWPVMPLPRGNYYIALYFQDNRTPSSNSWRMFEVSVNGNIFYKALNVSASVVTVFGKEWPLSGSTVISLVPDDKATVGPIINGGEILQIVPLGRRTVTRDVKAMEKIARSLNNPPADWRGDPCLPKENAWTGITCSIGKYAAVSAVNVTGLGLTGELSPSIDKLTALTSLSLGGNKLTGPIPEMSHLNKLVSLHLEDNQLDGPIPTSLGKLRNLKEVFLQNNNLEGPIPDSLKSKNGLTLQFEPGNQITTA
ncbi:hypothetical protein AQUCO_01400071v1 [Aquilegia coerulea]|uniref:Malectin-like domain-containing protein n=1 Tax=Aquilegia coerulea TaxID=218851 RepID=A0A2G5DUB2_AQUCA|nr:hypothetical protein AQUCO_01400071v1 [Aquilegia coerulea]